MGNTENPPFKPGAFSERYRYTVPEDFIRESDQIAWKEISERLFIKHLAWAEGEYEAFDERVRGIHQRLSVVKLKYQEKL